jgi:hypothetical protein
MNKNTESWLPPGVYARWCKLFPGVSAQPSEFYDLLQKALEQRKIPKIEISRVYHREGGIFSAKREYLRMSSERLVFDVCAAPFGTGFFISYWFAELPLINPLLILLGFAAFGVLSVIFAHVFGFWLGASLLALGVAFLGWYMRVGIGNFLADIDLNLLKLPWIGSVYRTFFRRITYYRIDATQMYYDAVNGTIMQAIDEFTTAQGIKPLTDMERTPVLKYLYRTQAA